MLIVSREAMVSFEWDVGSDLMLMPVAPLQFSLRASR